VNTEVDLHFRVFSNTVPKRRKKAEKNLRTREEEEGKRNNSKGQARGDM
jgi:hypothetical protein